MNLNRERISQIVSHPTTRLATVGVVSFCGGIVVGRVTKRYRLSDEDRKEIEQISEELAKMHERHESYIAEEVESAIALEDDEVRVVEIIEPDPEPEEDGPEIIRRNVFAESTTNEYDDWDYEAEKQNRNSEDPYVLHKDEFYADELGFNQRTYVYYDGDDILADEDDKPIYNHAQITGELKFGHGSGDQKVVYIRNEKRKEEYEIIKDPGLFSVEVMGLEIENNTRVKGRIVEHSTKRFPLKE